MRRVMILIALAYTVHSAQAVDTVESSKLEPGAARVQISQALLDSADSPEGAIEDLRTTLDRVEDPALGAIISYNLGVLHQSQDEFEEAVRHYELADLASPDASLRTKTRFNLGHVLYTKAHDEESPKSIEDFEKRIAALLRSANAFRSVIEISPAHLEAAQNTERVRKEIHLLRQIKEQLEKQKQEMEDLADQLKDQAEQQKQQADQTEDSPPQDEESEQQQQQDQQQLSEESSETNDQLEKNNPESSAAEDLQDAMKAQKEAEEAMERGDQEEAAQKQQEAAEKLEQAAEKLQQEADQMQKGEKGEPQDEQESENEQESEQEGESENESKSDQIDQLAKDLLDKERREREQRTYRAKGRPVRVEKDW